MEPVAFLELAKDLCKKSNDEAALRSAVSRGYYGLFNSVKRFVEENVQQMPKGAESHKKVYRYLNNCGLREVVDVAGSLNDLREERNDSDYDLKVDKFKDTNSVTFLYLKARKAYDDFEIFCRNSKNRKKLVRGIAEYMNKTKN